MLNHEKKKEKKKKGFFCDFFFCLIPSIKQFDILKMRLSLPPKVVEWRQVRGYFGWRTTQSCGSGIVCVDCVSQTRWFSKLWDNKLDCSTDDQPLLYRIFDPFGQDRGVRWLLNHIWRYFISKICISRDKLMTQWIDIWDWYFCHPVLVVLSICNCCE
jgi:hypothetical protein